MKKKALYISLITISIVAMVTSTILSVYYVTKLKSAPSFDAFLLVMSIGFIALTIFALIMSFVLYVKMQKENKDGKNS